MIRKSTKITTDISLETNKTVGKMRMVGRSCLANEG